MPYIPRVNLTPEQNVQERMLAADRAEPPALRKKSQPRLGIAKISLKTYRPDPCHLIQLFFGHGRS